MPAPPRAPQTIDDHLAVLLRACDVVFGSTSVVLAVFGVWLFATGGGRLATMIALWSIPAFNITWSVVGRRLVPSHPDLWRNAISLPIATYLYIVDPGTLERLWLPSLMLLSYAALSLGMASGRPVRGYLVSLAYSLGLATAATVQFGALDFTTVRDASGVLIVGLVLSLVGSKLGRSFEDATQQRDLARAQQERAEHVAHTLAQRTAELTRTLDNLQIEIAERARIELELRQAQKLESVGRLAAGVAHEINTPVQFVNDSLQFVREAMRDVFVLIDKLGVAQRALTGSATSLVDAAAAAAAARAAETDADLPYLTEHVPQALERAIEGLGRVATIVRSLKEFAHPGSRTMAAADLNRAITSTLTMACHEYRYIAELETELGELPLVWCHVSEFNQAVLNIVVNAAHAIREVVAGTPHMGKIRVSTRRDGDDVVIAIADTGPGIPDAIIAHIFDPFFTTKEVGQGTGQGLAIAHAVIVDKHGGKLGIETALGEGTTFVIRMPIDERPALAVK